MALSFYPTPSFIPPVQASSRPVVALSSAQIIALYLNSFNEIVMLIEQLPDIPDLVMPIMAWRPVRYQDMFVVAPLAQTTQAHPLLEGLDPAFKYEFEEALCALDEQAYEAITLIRQQIILMRDMPVTTLRPLCIEMSQHLRPLLERSVDLIQQAINRANETAQKRADRLLASRLRLLGEE